MYFEDRLLFLRTPSQRVVRNNKVGSAESSMQCALQETDQVVNSVLDELGLETASSVSKRPSPAFEIALFHVSHVRCLCAIGSSSDCTNPVLFCGACSPALLCTRARAAITVGQAHGSKFRPFCARSCGYARRRQHYGSPGCAKQLTLAAVLDATPTPPTRSATRRIYMHMYICHIRPMKMKKSLEWYNLLFHGSQ